MEYFPSYAPELNPVEYVWGYLKMNKLSNKVEIISVNFVDQLKPEITKFEESIHWSSSLSPIVCLARLGVISYALVSTKGTCFRWQIIFAMYCP